MHSKRSSARLMFDLLQVIQKKKAINTNTLSKANISSEMQQYYVKKASDEGLLKASTIKRKRRKEKIIWELTDKGHEFINDYDSFIKKYPFTEYACKIGVKK